MATGRRRSARARAAHERAVTSATLALVRADLTAEREQAFALAERERELVRGRDAAIRRLHAVAVRLQLDAPPGSNEALDELDRIVDLLDGAAADTMPASVPDVAAEVRALAGDAAAAVGLRPAVAVSGAIDAVPPLVARRLLSTLRGALADALRRTGGDALAVDLTATGSAVTLTVAADGTAAADESGTPDSRLADAAELGGWCVRSATDSGAAVVWHAPYDRGLVVDPLAPDTPPAAAIGAAIGRLTARLATASGADRLAVTGSALRTLVAADGYLVVVGVDAGRRLEVVRSGGFGTDADPVGRLLPVDSSVPGHVVTTGRPVRIGSVVDIPPTLRHLGFLPADCALIVPLRLAATAVAVCLTRRPGRARFQQSDEDAAVTLAAVASAVLELQPVQDVIDTWPAAEFDYTGSSPARGFPYDVEVRLDRAGRD